MQAVCARVAQGEYVKVAAEAEGVDPSSVREWALDDEFAALYARARESQAHALAEEALRIADEDCATSEAVQRNRLRVDTRKWYTSKIAPRHYGERQQVAVDGGVTVRVEYVESDE